MAKFGEAQIFYHEVVLAYEENECLTWPFALNAKGYGRMFHKGKNKSVSRLVCEEVNGPPPTPDHQAAHSCGKGHEGCVTKRHLSWKTPKENSEDAIAHGTTNSGERNPKAKLTGRNVQEIRSLKGSIRAKLLAERFGISQHHVYEIQSRRMWSWL